MILPCRHERELLVVAQRLAVFSLEFLAEVAAARLGTRQSVEGSPGLPKPVQRDERSGGVPIVMGGWGAKRTPRLAAQYAAEYNLPFSPAANVADQFAIVRGACEKAGRDPSTLTLSCAVVACCGEDGAAFEPNLAMALTNLSTVRWPDIGRRRRKPFPRPRLLRRHCRENAAAQL